MTTDLPPIRPPHSRIQHFLWFCAGADAEMLRRCPNSDRVKFEGMGGVVVATASLAFLSGSYAFYTIFEPKEDTVLAAVQQGTDWATAAFAIAAGLAWSLVIFNLDRFIVSSGDKGDGTSKITWDEFTGALPRLVLALAIAVTISKPLEVRIMEPEIEAALELKQQDYRKALDEKVEGEHKVARERVLAEMDEVRGRVEERRAYLEGRRLEIKEQRRELELEAEGASGSGKAGRGPAWQDKKDNLDEMQRELEQDRITEQGRAEDGEAELVRLRDRLDSLEQRHQEVRETHARQSNSLDGLVERIKIAHEISPTIGYALMMLFALIEISPVLFKLMLVKGPYDYLEENRKRLICAERGIQLKGTIIVTPEGGATELPQDVYLHAETTLGVEQKRLATERRLAEHGQQVFEEHTRDAMSEDIQAYLEQD